MMPHGAAGIAHVVAIVFDYFGCGASVAIGFVASNTISERGFGSRRLAKRTSLLLDLTIKRNGVNRS